MKVDVKEIQDKILNYLYDNRESSPKSLTKIRVAINLEDSKGDLRLLKTGLEALIKKDFIKKQEDRGNYKIEPNGIEHVERK